MSILDGIKDKAKDLLSISEPYATRKVGVYDASTNKVFVAGLLIDGLVSSAISADSITNQETGIDYYYTTYHEVITQRTLIITVLPTAKCLPVLRLLALRQLENKGWFNLAVHENNNIVNVYRGWIMDLPEISMSQDSADRTIMFGIKPMHSGVSVIDQPSEFEEINYSKYGINPTGYAKSRARGLDDVVLEPLPIDSPEKPYE
jgi:hypothetical protein